VENLINCPSCGGETPANVTVCLRCFTNLESSTSSSPAGDVGHPPADTGPAERPDVVPSTVPAPATAAPDQPRADDDEDLPSYAEPASDEDIPDDAAGLLFPWGWLPVEPGNPLQVGRGGANPVPGFEAHQNLSRLHARIERTEGGLSVTDLQSTNGTFLNGRRLTPGVPTEARPGDLLRFAATLEAIVDEGSEE
jgi:hypothetical protein